MPTKTVLIVEDDEPTQKLLETLMSRNGVQSIVAGNGSAAIEVLESRPDVDCMILDIMMPAVGGQTVLSHLADTGRDLPVIVCTAAAVRPHTFDASRVRAVVQKPFDIEQLMALVQSLIE